MANLQWHDVQANFGDANSLLSTGMQSISKVGDVFSKIRDRQLEQEKLDREMAYKELALEEEIAHHIAQEDLENARFGENQYQYDTTFKYNKEKDERNYSFDREKFKENVRQFNATKDLDRQKAILEATSKILGGGKDDLLSRDLFRASIGLGLGGRSSSSSGSGFSYGLMPGISLNQNREALKKQTEQAEQYAEAERARRRNEQINILAAALNFAGIPVSQERFDALRRSMTASENSESSSVKPASDTSKLNPALPASSGLGTPGIQPKAANAGTAGAADTPAQPANGTPVASAAAGSASGTPANASAQSSSQPSDQPQSISQQLNTSDADINPGLPQVPFPKSEYTAIRQMKQDKMNRDFSEMTLNMSLLSNMPNDDVRILANTKDVAAVKNVLTKLKINPNLFSDSELKSFGEKLKTDILDKNKNWEKLSEVEKNKIIVKYLYGVDISDLAVENEEALYSGLQAKFSRLKRYRYTPITISGGIPALIDTNPVVVMPDIPGHVKTRIAEFKKRRSDTPSTIQERYDNMHAMIYGKNESDPKPGSTDFGGTAKRFILSNASDNAKKRENIKNASELGDYISSTGLLFMGQGDKEAIRRTFTGLFKDLDLDISDSDSEETKMYKMKNQADLFDFFLSSLRKNKGRWTRAGRGVFNLWGSDFNTDQMYKDLLESTPAKSIISKSAKVRDQVAYTKQQIKNGELNLYEYHETGNAKAASLKSVHHKRLEMGRLTVDGKNLNDSEVKMLDDTSPEVEEKKEELLNRPYTNIEYLSEDMSDREATLRARVIAFEKEFKKSRNQEDKDKAFEKALALAEKLYIKGDDRLDIDKVKKDNKQIIEQIKQERYKQNNRQ